MSGRERLSFSEEILPVESASWFPTIVAVQSSDPEVYFCRCYVDVRVVKTPGALVSGRLSVQANSWTTSRTFSVDTPEEGRDRRKRLSGQR